MRRLWADSRPRGALFVLLSVVLIRVPRGGDVRNELRRRGFTVRRGDTFPGLGPGLAADRRARTGDVRRVRPFPPRGADMTQSDHALAALEIDAFDGIR